MWLDRRNVPKEVEQYTADTTCLIDCSGHRAQRSRISTSPLPAGIIELNEGRHDLLTVFGIWIHALSGLEQRQIFGTELFLQFIYLLDQLLGFLPVFLPSSLVDLILAIWQ